jgi:phage-related protein
MSDLTINPEYPIATRPLYESLTIRFENGVEQSRPRRLNAIREFDLVYRNRPSADIATIEALFHAKYESALSFTWDNPEDGQTYTVRFKDQTWQKSYKMYNLWDLQFTLVQVL